MNTQSTLERVVSDWLGADAPTRAPDQLLRSTLERVGAIGQNRVYWPSRQGLRSLRSMRRNPTTPRYATAAAVVLVVTLAGAAVLLRPAGVVSPPPSTSTPHATSEPSGPSDGPLSSPMGGSQPVGVGPLAPGRYHFSVELYGYRGEEYENSTARYAAGEARLSFRLPEGWLGDGQSVFKADSAASVTVRLAASTIGRVYEDPCNPAPAIVDTRPVRTMDGLAETLTTRWLGAPETLPTATDPLPATLGGYDARYVELIAPPGLDPAACEGGVYTLWSDTAGRNRAADGHNQLDRVWIVDVDDSDRLPVPGPPLYPGSAERIFVFAANSLPATPAEDLAELDGVIDTIEVEFDDTLQSGSRALQSGSHKVYQASWSGLIGPLDGYVELNLPHGWSTDDSGRVFEGGPGQPIGMGVQVGTIKHVYSDPCNWTGGLSDADMGHGSSHPAYIDMANALTGDGADPQPTDLGDREGLMLTLTTPASLEGCDLGEFRRWVAAPGYPAFVHRPGQVDLVWLLDPDRELVVVHGWHYTDTSSEARTQLLDMIESATYSLP